MSEDSEKGVVSSKGLEEEVSPPMNKSGMVVFHNIILGAHEGLPEGIKIAAKTFKHVI